MCWNNGYKKKKFEQFEKKQMAEYRRAGISEEDIKEIYKFDYDLFCRERIFVDRTQPMVIDDYFDSEARNPLCKNFLDDFSVQMVPFERSRYGWIEQIENQLLYEALIALTDVQKEILTLIYIYGYSESYIATQILKVSISAVHYRLSVIYKKIEIYFLKKEDCTNE